MLPSLERHQRVRAVFDTAVLMESSARDAYLDRACGDDAALRLDVVRLLAHHDDARSFLEHPLGLPSEDADAAPFAGTDRFRVIRRLGAGGMGVVYEVEDAGRGEVVALKTLRRANAPNVYQLKQEFRSLADVTHRNLACLYELFVDGDQCFFTMELVSGVSFVDYVRGGADATPAVDRLVPALRQLVDGISALHRRGKLHRDIKPSNVLVTGDGRVVVLDFGLMADTAAGRGDGARHVRGGTPAYMAPEAAVGAVPSTASDWYAVGATLYEALTGHIPFAGREIDILRLKSTEDPPSPEQVAPGTVPPHLNTICVGLLRRDPGTRSNGAAVLAALDGSSVAPVDGARESEDPPFVGRGRELQALEGAREAAANGAARVAAVCGPSGIGKSALLRRFLETAATGGVVVVAGRCYENESVPYKAFDGVIDDVTRHLASLASDDVERALPVDVAALARVFPALLQVGAVRGACHARSLASLDPLQVRSRAFDAFGALLRALATRRPVIVWIDDLQWADADSIVLLDELLGPSRPPAVLTVLSFRSEEIADKPFLQTAIDRAHPALVLEPMTDAEAYTLIEGLVPRALALTDADRLQLTREAGGSPFVLEQLTLHAAKAGRTGQGPPTFERMFNSRLDALSAEGRLFLDTLATCGRAVSPELVCDACGITRDRQSLVVMLRALRLIRSSGSSARIETYHDRIREVLSRRLEPEALREIHYSMVRALVARGSDDCEALYEHYRGAGDAANAAMQGGLAAERAAAALAFDRAASFYARALELWSSAAEAQGWREGHASALANAGRPGEAADAYLSAAAGAGHARQVELRRRAAEQFLIGGYIDRGLDLVMDVLRRVGVRGPSSPRAAMLSLLWRRARLTWRGVDFVPRRVDDIDPEALLRLDTCWAAATGLGLVDVVIGSDFIARHLHMALDCGEPSRVARGLALESAARHADWPFRRGAAPLVRRSSELARTLGTPNAAAMELLAESVAATAVGEWKRALTASEASLAMLRDRCVGVTWETTIAQNMVIWSLMYLGELREVSRRVPPLLADARRRGNLYLATELCTRSNYVWLAADDPDGGEREAEQAVATWSQRAFHRQHYSATLARAQTALYRGDGEAASRILDAREAELRRSMLTRVQVFRVEWHYLRGRSALAAASAARAPERFLRAARVYARRIARERMPWATPLALLLESGIQSVEGQPTAAHARLQDALVRFERADMKLYAAVTRRRLGALRSGPGARDTLRRADNWMAEQEIRNPSSMTRMLAPGFPD